MRTALLDGDVYLFQAAMKADVMIDWEDGLWTLHADEAVAVEEMLHLIERDVEATEADTFAFALSDPDRSNLFRKQVLPTYKAARTVVRKPTLISYLRTYALKNFRVFEKPTLEGDDVLGILLTHPGIITGEKVCVSIDKDLRTVPGLHYNPMHADYGIFEVSAEEGEAFFLKQVLAGDAVDGYGGCPGTGMTGADKAFELPLQAWVEEEHTLKSGPNKGETATRWKKQALTGLTVWDVIVSYYEKAGLNEQEALRQARCARILQHQDYDFDTAQAKLWNPR